MFETFIALFTRLVVAVEIIAKGNNVSVEVDSAADEPEKKTTRGRSTKVKEEPEEDEPKKTTRGRPSKTKDDSADDEPKKTTRGRSTKPKADPEIEGLRKEIAEIAKLMVSDETDDADKIQDALDDVLEKYEVTSVAKVSDDDIRDFHADLKEAAEEFFDLDEE